MEYPEPPSPVAPEASNTVVHRNGSKRKRPPENLADSRSLYQPKRHKLTGSLRKNLRSNEWEKIAFHIWSRNLRIQDVALVLCGREQAHKQVERSLRRYLPDTIQRLKWQDGLEPCELPLEVEVVPPRLRVDNLPWCEFREVIAREAIFKNNFSIDAKAITSFSVLSDLGTTLSDSALLAGNEQLSLINSKTPAFNTIMMGVLFISNHMSHRPGLSLHMERDLDRFVNFLASGPTLSLLRYILNLGGSTAVALSEILFKHALNSSDMDLASTILAHQTVDVNRKLPGPWYFKTCYDHEFALLPLEAAILSGDVSLVQFLLKNGANVDASGSKGEPMLGIAVHIFPAYITKHSDTTESVVATLLRFGVQNEFPAVQYFLKRGKIQHATELAKSIATKGLELKHHPLTLVLTSRVGCLELVQLLLVLKADANASHRHETPLIAASSCGHKAIVETLLPHVLDIDARAQSSCTALSAAAGGGHFDVVKILLGSKADVNALEKPEQSALVQATEARHSDIVKLLLEIKHKEIILGYALQTAVASRSEDIVTLILKSNLNLSGWALNDALRYASTISMTEVLLERGADPNTPSQDWAHGTLLDAAIDTENSDAVKVLLQYGADPNLSLESWYLNGLGTAVSRGNVELTRRLLENVGDINSVHKERTALRIAAENGQLEIATLLLESGASTEPLEITQSAKTPSTLQIAAARRDAAMIAMLLAKKADPNYYHAPPLFMDSLAHTATLHNSPLLEAIDNDEASSECVRLLVQAGARVDEISDRPKRGANTAVAVAVRCRNYDIIKIFLDSMAPDALFDDSAKVKARTFLLHAAAEVGDFELMERALDFPGDMNLMSTIKTAVVSAIMSEELQDEQCEKVVLFLMEKGGMINFLGPYPDSLGDLTPLAAAVNSRPHLIPLLRQMGASLNDLRALHEAMSTSKKYHSLLTDLSKAVLQDPRWTFHLGQEFLSKALQNDDIQLCRILFEAIDCSPDLQSHEDFNEMTPQPQNQEQLTFRSILAETLLRASKAGSVSFLECLLDEIVPTDPYARTQPRNRIYSCLRLSFELAIQQGLIIEVLQAWPMKPEIRAGVVRLWLRVIPAIEPDILKHFCLINHGEEKTMVLLLDAGAQLQYGNLIDCLRLRNIEAIKILLERGLDIPRSFLKDGGGEVTFLQFAAKRGDRVLVELLLEHGANPNDPPAPLRGMMALQAAAISGSLPTAIKLLENGADVNAPGAEEKGRTALEGAAEWGRIDMVQLLLNAGSDVKRTAFGRRQYENAVRFARDEGHDAVAKLIEIHHSQVSEKFLL